MLESQSSLEERDWEILLRRIRDGKCTPFVGSEASSTFLPSRNQLAEKWAHQYDYPLSDSQNIAQVAQYLSVQYDPLYPKEEIQQELSKAPSPNFDDPLQPHSVLANLNLPIYITTNYDDLMLQALKHHNKDPQRELCRWNPQLQRSQPSILQSGFEPSSANPLVYHLHGVFHSPESLVLTEDDYLDFLVNISSTEYELPTRIQRAVTGASLLFVGYDPTEWDFRVLFRGLIAASEAGLRRISVTVQLPPMPSETPKPTMEKVQGYLDRYFSLADNRMRVYWGTTEQFLQELWQRWQGEQLSNTSSQEKPPLINLGHLLKTMVDAFNKEELITLAFELRVDYENLPDPKDSFARELIVYMQNRKRLFELIDICRERRPAWEW